VSPSAAAARATAAGAHPAAHPAAPAPRPVGPRRVSGPARPAERVQRPTIDRPASPAPFTAHVARVVDHSLLDRLIRGRAWIGLIAFALIGIVAMQVTLLKLNAGIGSSIDRAAALQRESSLLAAQVAGLSSAQRVQAEATQLGMVYAPPGDVRYLRASPGDAARAAASLVASSAGATGSAGSISSAGSTTPAGSTSSAGASLGGSTPSTTSTTSTTSTPSTGAAVTASTGP
jgi:hypothetical protein